MHLHLRFRRIVALVAGLLLTLSIHAQVITKSFRGVPLKTVLEEVEKQTGYSFLLDVYKRQVFHSPSLRIDSFSSGMVCNQPRP